MSDPKPKSIIVPAYKTFNAYSPLTCEYAHTVGLRNDELRDNLEKESQELFGRNSVMMTQRQECELFEAIIRFAGASKCIEIGVFTGASSISIARGLPEHGKLIALDINEDFTNLARKYWKLAGVEHKINLVLGPADEYLQKLIDDGEEGTFDFAYIDANKTGYDSYYEKLIRLLRRGGMIAVDNVFWDNCCADDSVNDEETVALRNLNVKLLRDERVKNFILPLADGINIVTKL